MYVWAVYWCRANVWFKRAVEVRCKNQNKQTNSLIENKTIRKTAADEKKREKQQQQRWRRHTHNKWSVAHLFPGFLLCVISTIFFCFFRLQLNFFFRIASDSSWTWIEIISMGLFYRFFFGFPSTVSFYWLFVTNDVYGEAAMKK